MLKTGCLDFFYQIFEIFPNAFKKCISSHKFSKNEFEISVYMEDSNLQTLEAGRIQDFPILYTGNIANMF